MAFNTLRSGTGDTEIPSGSDGVVINKKITSTTIKETEEQNVLNNYRSYTYNFTLAALSIEASNDPTLYRNAALDMVILRSGGKGAEAFATDKITNSYAKDLVDKFNKNSPGALDMFIDNVEIETLMAFNPNGGLTLPTSFRFEVIEPLSINGFIEALHVGAVAAGHPNYQNAAFLLKVEFQGYSDNDQDFFPSATVIDKTTRYFPISITNITVDIGTNGTRYSVTAIPSNEKGFGATTNELKKPINMAGGTIKTVLESFATNLSEQIKEADDNAKANKSNLHDIYEIKFPKLVDGKWDKTQENEIASVKIIEVLKEKGVYQFPAPGDPNTPSNAYKVDGKTEFVRLNPGAGDSKPVVQFGSGVRIHEAISAVIRDSEFLTHKLRDLANNLDKDGYLDYFQITLEVTNLGFDKESRKPYQKFTYLVVPYKIHFTRIPNYYSANIDQSKIISLSRRSYRYIYTGQNIDMIDFNLNFNNLFYEAVPVGMAVTDQLGSRDAAGPDPATNPKITGENSETLSRRVLGTPIRAATSDAGEVNQPGGRGNQIQSDDPYAALAVNFHNAIANFSMSGQLQGEFTIIGDPYYLVTGGMGNYLPAMDITRPRTTVDGEASHLFGEVLVTVRFNNPLDINPLEQGGTYSFDPKFVPYSGIYRVNKVQSIFREGTFKQRLSVIRMNGQLDNDGTPTTPINEFVNSAVTSVANPFNAIASDTADNATPSSRPGTLNLLQQLARGLPSIGLPGQLSNFVNAAGVAGGVLTQVSGAQSNGIGKLTAAASVYGGAVPGGTDQSSLGIRINASSLSDPKIGVTGAISDAGSKVTSLVSGTPSDPTGLASGAGINVNQLSGLGLGLKSKVTDQIPTIAKSIPNNVDVSKLQSNGVVLGNIPTSKLVNIPPTAPTMVAPDAEVNAKDAKDLATAFPSSSNPFLKILNIKLSNPFDKVLGKN
jgi:hypothetical protein